MLLKKDNLNNILRDKPALYLASQEAQVPQCLASSIDALDQFFEGGLRIGELTEWGAPLGRGGRDVIIRYLTQQQLPQSEKQWCLWVSGREDVQVYPPAWMARGVDLARVRFSYCANPVEQLKPALMDPFFRIIVLDGVKHLSMEDCAFLAQRARINKQAIFLIRDYFLSVKQGNVWAKLRVNCWQDDDGERFHLRVIRGLSPRELAIEARFF